MERSTLMRFQKLFESQVQTASPFSREQTDLNMMGDAVDQASQLQEQLLGGALENRKLISIQGAKAALDRIRKGCFGICEECGEDIDIRRLEIHPTTSFCIQCQEELEHKIGA
jgi:DnaK suppressor protein